MFVVHVNIHRNAFRRLIVNIPPFPYRLGLSGEQWKEEERYTHSVKEKRRERQDKVDSKKGCTFVCRNQRLILRFFTPCVTSFLTNSRLHSFRQRKEF
jgi:hypothetical protein